MEIKNICFGSVVTLLIIIFVNVDAEVIEVPKILTNKVKGKRLLTRISHEIVHEKNEHDPSIEPIENHLDGSIEIEKIRKKRHAEQMLAEMKERLRVCRKIKNDESCDDLYKRIIKVANELTGKFVELKSMVNEFQTNIQEKSVEKKKTASEKLIANENNVNTPLMNKFVSVAPKIHEDIRGNDNDKFWNLDKIKLVEEIIRKKEKDGEENRLHENEMTSNGRDSDDKTITPLKNVNFGM